MLRTIFVLVIAAIGAGYSLRGPFEILLFYLWIAYFRPEYWMWNPGLLLTLHLSLVVGFFLLLRGFPHLFKARFDARALLLLVFLIHSGVSAMATSYSPASSEGWLEFGKTLAVAYMMYAITSRDIARFRICLIVIAYSIGLESVKQGYVGLLLHPGGLNANTLPQLGDNNGVAVGMLMIAATFGALAATAPRWWEKRLHQFFFVGAAYRTISTYSRGAFLSLAALALVYVFRSTSKIRAILATIVVAAVVFAVLPQTFWDRMATMTVSSEEQMDASAGSRLHFWRVAIHMANQHPVLGVGYNAYNSAYNDYDFSYGFFGKSRSAHSIWFGVLAELGYPGFVLFVLMMLFAVFGMFPIMRRAKKGELPMEFYHYAVAIQAAFTAAFVGGSFVPWQYTEMLWHFVALSMSLRVLALEHVPAVQEVPVPLAPPHRSTGFQPAPALGRARLRV